MCGGEFKRVINEMTKDGPCPYCESKKVLAGYNGLKTTCPDIAKEWGIENYLLGDLKGINIILLSEFTGNVLNAILDTKCQLMIGSSKNREGMNRAGNALAE